MFRVEYFWKYWNCVMEIYGNNNKDQTKGYGKLNRDSRFWITFNCYFSVLYRIFFLGFGNIFISSSITANEHVFTDKKNWIGLNCIKCRTKYFSWALFEFFELYVTKEYAFIKFIKRNEYQIKILWQNFSFTTARNAAIQCSNCYHEQDSTTSHPKDQLLPQNTERTIHLQQKKKNKRVNIIIS